MLSSNQRTLSWLSSRGTCNPEGYNPESTLEYSDPGIYLPERFYVTGKWMNDRQYLRFNGDVGEDGAILLPYQALEVNAVMGSRNGSLCEVILWQIANHY